jgi:cytochrome c biogenesis protein CcmG, thiol:disulfide interchange protein DsbE
MGRVVRAVAVAGVLALLALLVWDMTHGSGGGVAAKVDRGRTVTAPEFRLPYLHRDGTFDLAAYRGKVVVLNFWASWCVDCKLEAKTLAAAARRWKDKNVVVVGVDTKDFAFAASRYMKRYGVDYPVVRDISGSLDGRFGVTGYPETFFVDRNGRVTPPHIVGPITPGASFSTKDLEQTISRLAS